LNFAVSPLALQTEDILGGTALPVLAGKELQQQTVRILKMSRKL